MFVKNVHSRGRKKLQMSLILWNDTEFLLQSRVLSKIIYTKYRCCQSHSVVIITLSHSVAEKIDLSFTRSLDFFTSNV